MCSDCDIQHGRSCGTSELKPFQLARIDLNLLQILCAVLNRITNFLAPFGSLSYLNWYCGETATAMIVANVPHLWPLIARIFKLGSFSQITTNNKS